MCPMVFQILSNYFFKKKKNQIKPNPKHFSKVDYIVPLVVLLHLEMWLCEEFFIPWKKSGVYRQYSQDNYCCLLHRSVFNLDLF